MEKSGKKIVVIGGGTGVFTALMGLKKYFKDPAAIVTMADDGGSTGILREEFGILPPGDVRRALVALSAVPNAMLSKLFSYRFKEGSLSGHSFGNLMITALERITGNFEKAAHEAGKILQIEGKVFPVTLDKTKLYAKLKTGETIRGETNIDLPKGERAKIDKVWLEPRARLAPAARAAILSADAIVVGPGDLYTSIVPNLLVYGMTDALTETRAKKIYVVNLMTKFGETDDYRATDFLRTVENYLGRNVLDFILTNSKEPSLARLKAYRQEKSEIVLADVPISLKSPKPVLADLLRDRGFLRHDSEKLARAIASILERK